MTVQDRIQKIGKYFKGMKVDTINGDNVIYVIVQYPPKWMVNNEEMEKKYGVNILQQGQQGLYVYCTEISNGFDCVFDAIDDTISKMLIIIERTKLMTQKIDELQELFENEDIPIESLRTLEFKYKLPKPKKKMILEDAVADKQEDENEDMNNIENQEQNE